MVLRTLEGIAAEGRPWQEMRGWWRVRAAPGQPFSFIFQGRVRVGRRTTRAGGRDHLTVVVGSIGWCGGGPIKAVTSRLAPSTKKAGPRRLSRRREQHCRDLPPRQFAQTQLVSDWVEQGYIGGGFAVLVFWREGEGEAWGSNHP